MFKKQTVKKIKQTAWDFIQPKVMGELNRSERVLYCLKLLLCFFLGLSKKTKKFLGPKQKPSFRDNKSYFNSNFD